MQSCRSVFGEKQAKGEFSEMLRRNKRMPILFYFIRTTPHALAVGVAEIRASEAASRVQLLSERSLVLVFNCTL